MAFVAKLQLGLFRRAMLELGILQLYIPFFRGEQCFSLVWKTDFNAIVEAPHTRDSKLHFTPLPKGEVSWVASIRALPPPPPQICTAIADSSWSLMWIISISVLFHSGTPKRYLCICLSRSFISVGCWSVSVCTQNTGKSRF